MTMNAAAAAADEEEEEESSGNMWERLPYLQFLHLLLFPPAVAVQCCGPLPLPWSLLSNNVSGEYAHGVLSQASYPQVKISGWLEAPERPKSRTEGAKQLKPISRSKKQVDCTPQLCNLTKCKGHQPDNHNRVTEIM